MGKDRNLDFAAAKKTTYSPREIGTAELLSAAIGAVLFFTMGGIPEMFIRSVAKKDSNA